MKQKGVLTNLWNQGWITIASSILLPTLSPSHSVNSTNSALGSQGVESLSTTALHLVNSFVDTTTGAETLWAMKVVICHVSNNSCKRLQPLFQTMFPDSRVAAEFSLGSDKVWYIINQGLAPHFFKQLSNVLQNHQSNSPSLLMRASIKKFSGNRWAFMCPIGLRVIVAVYQRHVILTFRLWEQSVPRTFLTVFVS
jgi:hypothetical protein